jgi:hypothetical protein
VEPSRLAYGSWCHASEKQIGEGDIRASYSADRIGMGQPIRKPFRYAGALWVRISEVLDTYFAKSRTSVSLSPGQLAQIGQECLVEFQAAMISAFSPWVKRDGARVLRMLSPSRAMR